MYIKKLLKNKIAYCALVFTVGFFFFGYNNANAAMLQINSNSTVISPGDTTTLNFIVNTENIAINNAEARITFPADKIEVLSINKNNSVFSLWVEDPSFSNTAGIITFNGGVPTPGYIGAQGSIISVVVKAKKVGQAEFVFSNTAVRANDGLGTNVLNNQFGKVITIIDKEKPQVISLIPVISVVQLSSLTHPDQNQWYKDKNPIFKWAVPSGSDAVQTSIDNNASGAPRVIYSPAISEKTVKNLEDGVWYFKVRARKDGTWGSISTYIVRIDNSPPQKEEVAFIYDDNSKILNITANIQDITSGIDHYEIFINDVLIKNILPKDFINGIYNLAFNTPGDNTVKLLAVDRAGNSVESLGTFHTTVMVAPKPEPVQPKTHTDEQLLITIGSFTIPALYFFTIILCIIILLVLGAFKFGRHYGRFRHKFKVHTALVKGDNSKVLLLLKKRLEKHLEILRHIRHGRILTKEEKEIKEAIEGDLDEVDRAIEEQKAE